MRNSIITQLEFKDGIYQGQTLQSRYKQGIGVYLWENGSAYFGEWKSDQIDGNGILFLPPKTTIQGQFNSAKLHGNCLIQTRQAKYYGKWLNGLPNGNMTAHFKQGEVTIAFQDGKPTRGLSQREQSCEIPNLKSVQCYNSSALQTIDWLEGTFYGVTGKNAANKVAPNGLGVFVPKNGLFQCGQFKDGALNGLGRLQQPSGEVYQGFFENGKYHGRGIYLFKEDELQWAKGLWRFGELIEIFQNGLVKNCAAPKDLMFPYSDHKNPIQIRQPITLNNVKEIEDLFEIQFQRQEPIQKQTNASPSPEQKSKLSNYKYFQNSTTNSYKRISEALHGSKYHSSPERNSIQLINYYKGQLKDLNQNDQSQHNKSNKPQQKARKSHSNSQQYLIQSSRKKESVNNKSSSKLSQSAYVEEIKKLQTQFIKPFDQNKSVQSQQSQIYQAILDSEEHYSQRSDQFQEKQPSSSKDHIEQIIRKSKQYKKEQSVEQSRKSLLDQSRQSNQSKQVKSPKHLQQSKCKSSEGSKKLQQQHQLEDQNQSKSQRNKFQNEGNQQTEQLPLDTSQQSQQLWESRQIKEFSQPRDSKRSKQSSQPASQRISIKSINQVASQQITPQQSHREQQDQNKQLQLQQQQIQETEQLSQIQQVQQQNQTQQQMKQQYDNDHNKKISFCQQDFAQDMRNTAVFNQAESNQSSQMKFHKHKRSQSQTDFDKFEINDEPQMRLIKQYQQHMQQLIEQQQRELELLKTQQQQLEDENQISSSKPGFKTNVSMDSSESYPYQQSESFQQEFIKSVSDVLKSELKKKQEDSIIADNNNNSPHFEQSQIANNQQQSMLFNDIQSLDNVNVDNVNVNDRLHNRRSSQQQEDGKKSRSDSMNIKKQPVSHSELDDLQIDKLQDAQSRQSRRSGYSGENKQQRSQSHQSSQQNYPNQHHSFNQYQSQEQFYSQKQPLIIQEKIEQQGQSQQTKIELINSYKKQDHLSFEDNKQDQSLCSQQMSIISNQFPQEQNNLKKINQEDSIVKQNQLNQQDNNILKQKQQNTVQKKRQDKVQSRNEESIEELMKKQSQKQISQTQLKFVACPSQHSLPGQISFSDKQFQIKPDQMSENIQVTIVDDQSDTQQNIQEIKLQLAAQKEILSQLYHSIQESRQMKVSRFDSDKRTSEQRTVKRGMANGFVDPCSSPIKKVIITKGAYPAFTIIKSLSPIRL
ncbi:unnamed protein product (macronuclear) [Paramecium tetraurelia]|uniref:MORN repeat protein n=1 Tax=Paramecium tetraurelia TaxID=5888 RepID=A0D709_PARTE|nr:uncharacterized protein GSPATT00001867001 [Paramecium tetraurelia]CAK78826.1 unnamed protein product [Paramecium tetraurelia]|eukprot:XP_001446223.1 hypothetical protein (macronuclear) [Paramecium tetraurelia strain d4-2]